MVRKIEETGTLKKSVHFLQCNTSQETQTLDSIIQRVLDDYTDGVSIGGDKLNNSRDAADTTILVLMLVERILCLRQQWLPPLVEIVQEFNYFGSLISSPDSCKHKIRNTIAIKRSTIVSFAIWSNK